MSRRLLPVLLLLAATALAGCGGDDSDTASDSDSASPSAPADAGTPHGSADPADVTCDYPADEAPAAKEVDAPPSSPTVGGDVPATLATSLGDLKITLDAANAPCTVNSFVSLATQGY